MAFRSVLTSACQTKFWHHHTVPITIHLSNKTATSKCNYNTSTQAISKRGALICSPVHQSRFTLKILSAARFAKTSIHPLNPYKDTPPTDPKISPQMEIFVLRQSSNSKNPSLLVPRYTRPDSTQATSQLNPFLRLSFLDSAKDEKDAAEVTIWDLLQRKTYKETGLLLEKVMGTFDCVRHVEMEDGKRAEKTKMNWVVEVKRGEKDANLHPGVAVQWM